MKDLDKLKPLANNPTELVELYKTELLKEARAHDLSNWYSIEWIIDNDIFGSYDTYCKKCVFEITIDVKNGEIVISYDKKKISECCA
jgi:hypothetical protein